MITLLLHDDLAEHILMELAARLNGSVHEVREGINNTEDMMLDINTWKEDNICSIKKSILSLIDAASPALTHLDTSQSIPEILQQFVVGTEKTKTWKEKCKMPPKSSELAPVTDLQFWSTARTAKEKLRIKSEHNILPPSIALSDDGDDDDDDDEEEGSDHEADDSDHSIDIVPQDLLTFTPDYKRIWSLMCACGAIEDECKFIGVRLLADRANKQLNELDAYQKNALSRNSSKEWAILRKEAKKRSRRISQPQKDNLKRKVLSLKPMEKSVEPLQTTLSVVTPTPRIRRAGHFLPLCLQTPSTPSIPQAEQIPPTKREKKKYRKCHKLGCQVNNQNPEYCHIKFHQVPKHREELTSKSPRKQSVIQRQGINFQRREMLRRMRIDQNDRREFFICENHKFQDEVHYVEVGHNGKRWRQGFTLTLPVDIGPKSSQIESTTSKGLGGDRTMKRILDESKAIMDRGFLPCDQFDKENDESNGNVHKKRAKKEDSHAAVQRERDRYKADYVQATLALNQTFEQNAPEQHLKINPVLKRAAALDCHMTDPSLPPSDRTFFQAKLKSNPGTYDLIANSPPLVHLEIDDDEVKRRTGFVSLNAMLRYIFIVCNGDIDVMMKRCTSLTWFEEWFLHFEYKWGRTVSRAWDGRKYYGLSKRYFTSVIDSKYACERRARASWPRYASYEEDMKFRKDKWNVKFRDERIVMWDMTDIRAYGFSDADSQRLTYSKYYNGNVLKGGVVAQPCGWILTGDLWPGGISDSEYNRREGYLNCQEEVANNDLVDGVVKPFTIIYDKGYRAKMIAWKTGKQRVVQPIFAKSDQRFTRDQTLHSANRSIWK